MCEDQTEPENGSRQGEECGDVGGCSSDSVRRDGGGLLWGGKMEMEKGRFGELEGRGRWWRTVGSGRKERNHYDAQNPVWPGRKSGAICRDKSPH